MKLKQLLESFEPQFGTFPDTSKKREDVGGRGIYASVKGDEDPFMINKYSHPHVEDPGYTAYVKLITDNKLAQANPHFPRIYEISDGKWKMEKLPFTLRQYFESGDYHENKHNKEVICGMYLNDYDPANFDYWDFTYPYKIKLGTYRKALEIIHKFAKENNSKRESGDVWLGDDLHASNIMVRLTPQGPQLVITDPWG